MIHKMKKKDKKEERFLSLNGLRDYGYDEKIKNEDKEEERK